MLFAQSSLSVWAQRGSITEINDKGAFAMFDEEESPKPKGLQPLDLDVLSIDALVEYIEELEAEISRVQAKIESKKAARGAADAFFKS